MNEFNEYTDEIISIRRLLEFIPTDDLEWDESGVITMDDISNAIDKIPELSEPYGDTYAYPVREQKSREWHIGRIIYFIRHPDEITGIEIDNECFNGLISVQPFIVDGWHRWAAAIWLYNKNTFKQISCKYGGRLDVLEYLKDEIDELDYDPV